MASESNSSKVAPMCLAAIIDGASGGDMVTAFSRATDSIGGTSTLSPTVSSSQKITSGQASRRTARIYPGREVPWPLMRP
nr:hypothetical protein CPGR_02512 [Mycolicibacter nonchromogenicus]